ncbi:GRIP and coiled-coil domain-containing protein-like [Gordionus sp. m RMFG-2023]|uniref:GRIP and coiled-coil domain-containing protein-like n=1 Tax=Gordionus sp. m RMFG-2023 TaxID=3053472 RepID=UPI0031FCD4D1
MKCLTESEIAGLVSGTILGTSFITALLLSIILIKKKKPNYTFNSRIHDRFNSDDIKHKETYVNHRYLNDLEQNVFVDVPLDDNDPSQLAKTYKNYGEENYKPENKKNSINTSKLKRFSKPSISFTNASKKFWYNDEKYKPNSRIIKVPLKSQDVTGLGFNICGNVNDGIFIKDILNRGPAKEAGKLKTGDRILSLTISFNKMMYEDALTILSYGSPYEIVLELLRERPPSVITQDSSKSYSACFNDARTEDDHCEVYQNGFNNNDSIWSNKTEKGISKEARRKQKMDMIILNTLYRSDSLEDLSNITETKDSQITPFNLQINDKSIKSEKQAFIKNNIYPYYVKNVKKWLNINNNKNTGAKQETGQRQKIELRVNNAIDNSNISGISDYKNISTVSLNDYLLTRDNDDHKILQTNESNLGVNDLEKIESSPNLYHETKNINKDLMHDDVDIDNAIKLYGKNRKDKRNSVTHLLEDKYRRAKLNIKKKLSSTSDLAKFDAKINSDAANFPTSYVALHQPKLVRNNRSLEDIYQFYINKLLKSLKSDLNNKGNLQRSISLSTKSSPLKVKENKIHRNSNILDYLMNDKDFTDMETRFPKCTFYKVNYDSNNISNDNSKKLTIKEGSDVIGELSIQINDSVNVINDKKTKPHVAFKEFLNRKNDSVTPKNNAPSNYENPGINDYDIEFPNNHVNGFHVGSFPREMAKNRTHQKNLYKSDEQIYRADSEYKECTPTLSARKDLDSSHHHEKLFVAQNTFLEENENNSSRTSMKTKPSADIISNRLARVNPDFNSTNIKNNFEENDDPILIEISKENKNFIKESNASIKITNGSNESTPLKVIDNNIRTMFSPHYTEPENLIMDGSSQESDQPMKKYFPDSNKPSYDAKYVFDDYLENICKIKISNSRSDLQIPIYQAGSNNFEIKSADYFCDYTGKVYPSLSENDESYVNKLFYDASKKTEPTYSEYLYCTTDEAGNGNNVNSKILYDVPNIENRGSMHIFEISKANYRSPGEYGLIVTVPNMSATYHDQLLRINKRIGSSNDRDHNSSIYYSSNKSYPSEALYEHSSRDLMTSYQNKHKSAILKNYLNNAKNDIPSKFLDDYSPKNRDVYDFNHQCRIADIKPTQTYYMGTKYDVRHRDKYPSYEIPVYCKIIDFKNHIIDSNLHRGRPSLGDQKTRKNSKVKLFKRVSKYSHDSLQRKELKRVGIGKARPAENFQKFPSLKIKYDPTNSIRNSKYKKIRRIDNIYFKHYNRFTDERYPIYSDIIDFPHYDDFRSLDINRNDQNAYFGYRINTPNTNITKYHIDNYTR